MIDFNMSFLTIVISKTEHPNKNKTNFSSNKCQSSLRLIYTEPISVIISSKTFSWQVLLYNNIIGQSLEKGDYSSSVLMAM